MEYAKYGTSQSYGLYQVREQSNLWNMPIMGPVKFMEYANNGTSQSYGL